MTYDICFVGLTAAPVLLGRWSEASAGGAEVQQVLLARELARRGHRVSFVVQHPELPAVSDVDGIRTYCIRSPGVAPGFNALVKWRRLWRVLMHVRPTVIYQRMAEWTTGVSAAAAQSLGALFIHAVASDRELSPTGETGANLWQRWMYNWGIRRASLILVQHAGQLALLRENRGLSGHVFPSVYHAVPPTSSAPHAGVYWVGSIREVKRPHLLLEVARQIPELRFVMIGGPSREPGAAEYHERIVSEARSLPNVEFVGFVPPEEIDRRLAAAAVLVNTSSSEGLPVTFLQAWRQAVPTVGFGAAGRDEILEQSGWCVRSVPELVDLLRAHVVQPDAVVRERGQRAQAYFARNHAVDLVVPRLEALIAEGLCAASPAGKPSRARV